MTYMSIHKHGFKKWSNVSCVEWVCFHTSAATVLCVSRCQMYNSTNVFFVSEQILHNIKQEYKRLQKRRHLDSAFQQADGCCPLDLQNIHSGSVHPGKFKYHKG